MKHMFWKKAGMVFLGTLWVAVVAGAVYITVTQHQKYGYFSFIVPGMAVCMMTIFVLIMLAPRLEKKAWSKRLGDMAVGTLILFAIFVLAMGLYERRHHFFVVAVLGIFLLVFLGIFRDWVRSLWKSREKSSPKDNEPPDEEDRQEN
ncbi:MAG TPA: hypothetical protein PLI09_15185 [Candidatus Hydrogenedentes bacterium]|nr:hypothetical protein [Candidatus Hydrogenedentota bacterium]